MWSPDGATRTFDTASAGLAADLPFLLQPGEPFGPYRIVRPLGKGGMGQVYEAEEIESGRHVALKILSRGLGDDEERERFLSEGRAAASLSHPNTIYVFGTSEVQGFPVIAMALAPGGTLKERVLEGRPEPPAQAVDAVLDLIAGLDAAASLGILHRDVKPSNCFLDRDGRVLVGDFGLSISTAGHAAGERVTTIAGTPGFASPEQLRGEALDVRSDIYSVGATLYYLLTGRAPFEDSDVTRLTTRMAVEEPPPPVALRRDLPKGLSAVVMRCLARTPAGRYENHRALAGALEPFRSTKLVAAGVWRRLFAGVIDTYASGLVLAPVSMYFGSRFVTSANTFDFLLQSIPALLTVVLYYGWLEGRWGAAAGKALLGLRVTDRHGARCGYGRALARASIFVLPAHVISQAVQFAMLGSLRAGGIRYEVKQSSGGVQIGMEDDVFWTVVSIAASIVCFGLLFCTARRRNGFAGLHDLGSRTRVVLHRSRVEAREVDAARAAEPQAFSTGGRHIGPFTVTGEMPDTLPATVAAYDERLRRRVWIRRLPVGTAPLTPLRRDLARPTRLRWLAGRRTETEAWDAYEAPDGRPLAAIVAVPQSWARVRHWLHDLAVEIATGVDDGSLPALDLTHVWIGNDDHARLLDWSPGGTDPAAEAKPDLQSGCRFLYALAAASLSGGRTEPGLGLPLPLPVHARTLLESMRTMRVASLHALAQQVDATLRSPVPVRRQTRAAQVAICAVLPLVLPPIALAGIAMMRNIISADPDLFALNTCLQRLDGPVAPDERRALETYIATRLRAKAENPETWTNPYFALGVKPDSREAANRAIASYARASDEERERAERLVTPLLEREQKAIGGLAAGGSSATVALRVAVLGTYCATVLGLLGALLARGGLTLRIFGTALVKRDGRDASRVRALVRAVFAWAPVAILFALPRESLLAALPLAVMAAGALWAVWRPARGIQDRLAGTWIVPR